MPELASGLVATEADRLAQAEALVRSYCGWHIAPSRTETVALDPTGSNMLVLKSLHVTDVGAITEDGTAVTDEIAWNEAGIVVRNYGSWSVGPVSVVVTHGYDTPPAEVTAVVQAIAQRAVNNPGSLVRSQDGPFSDTYSQTGFNQSLPIALLDAEKAILDKYRLPALS